MSCNQKTEVELSYRQKNIYDLIDKIFLENARKAATSLACDKNHLVAVQAIEEIDKEEAELRKRRRELEKALQRIRDRLNIEKSWCYDSDATKQYTLKERTADFRPPVYVKRDLIRARKLRLLGKAKEAEKIEQNLISEFNLGVA